MATQNVVRAHCIVFFLEETSSPPQYKPEIEATDSHNVCFFFHIHQIKMAGQNLYGMVCTTDLDIETVIDVYMHLKYRQCKPILKVSMVPQCCWLQSRYSLVSQNTASKVSKKARRASNCVILFLLGDFTEAGEQLQTELAMEPRVFSGGTAYPKGTPYPRIMGPALRRDA